MMTIRRLDPLTDTSLFAQAYGWLETAPRWVQEVRAIFGSCDRTDYLAGPAAPGRIDIGVFEGDELVADITLTLEAKDMYEAHFDARRGTSLDTLRDAAQMVAAQMFLKHGAIGIFVWVPTLNRAVHQLNKAIGFERDGVTMLRGTCRGKLVEWVRYSMPNPWSTTNG